MFYAAHYDHFLSSFLANNRNRGLIIKMLLSEKKGQKQIVLSKIFSIIFFEFVLRNATFGPVIRKSAAVANNPCMKNTGGVFFLSDCE
jgi:hypothetical protein